MAMPSWQDANYRGIQTEPDDPAAQWRQMTLDFNTTVRIECTNVIWDYEGKSVCTSVPAAAPFGQLLQKMYPQKWETLRIFAKGRHLDLHGSISSEGVFQHVKACFSDRYYHYN